ncbi:hypothetical protein ACKVMT_05560 [Halobacteriales archaeon Cl-PHB]
MATETEERQMMEAAEETGMDPAVIGAAASVALSWYYFFVEGDREKGLFVGLWPPTIFAFVSYFQQTRMARRLESVTGTSRGIGESVQRMIEGR